MQRPIVTLLTDFGTSDSYVAEVKAVLLTWQPSVVIVDITHQVSPYDVEEAAFHLLRSYAWFPKHTYHLAVVDPGVGTARKNLYIRTRDYHFIGPDNGVLLWAVRACERNENRKAHVAEIPVPRGTKPTFHGRDVFAPFLGRGIANFGVANTPELYHGLTPVAHLEGKEFPRHLEHSDELIGQIVSSDHFGNLITSIPVGEAVSASAEIGTLRDRINFAPNYLSIPRGKVGLIRGSHGYWEIACATGSAASLLRTKKGDRVILYPERKNSDLSTDG